MADGLANPELIWQVWEAGQDYQVTPGEFSEIMGSISSIVAGVFAFGVLGMLLRGLAEGVTSFTSEESKHHSGGNMEIERHHGFVVKVGEAVVKTVGLPDWSLDFIEYQPEKRVEYRDALTKARVKTVKFTKSRIYFEQT